MEPAESTLRRLADVTPAGTTIVIDDLRLFGSGLAGFHQLDAITAAARGVPDRSDPRQAWTRSSSKFPANAGRPCRKRRARMRAAYPSTRSRWTGLYQPGSRLDSKRRAGSGVSTTRAAPPGRRPRSASSARVIVTLSNSRRARAVSRVVTGLTSGLRQKVPDLYEICGVKFCRNPLSGNASSG
jgi:hypothetical protein